MDWERSAEVVYTTDSELRRPREFLSRLLKDISGSWELTRSLLVRNINGQYRQTALGYLWAFIPPIATTLTFVFLQSQNIISSGQTDIPYPVFVLVGTILWQVFVDAMNSPLRLMHASTSMMACVNFPREAILFAGLGEVIFYFAIRVSLLLLVFIFFGVKLSLYILFFPLGVLSIMALGWGIGLLAVPFGLLYKTAHTSRPDRSARAHRNGRTEPPETANQFMSAIGANNRSHLESSHNLAPAVFTFTMVGASICRPGQGPSCP